MLTTLSQNAFADGIDSSGWVKSASLHKLVSWRDSAFEDTNDPVTNFLERMRLSRTRS